MNHSFFRPLPQPNPTQILRDIIRIVRDLFSLINDFFQIDLLNRFIEVINSSLGDEQNNPAPR